MKPICWQIKPCVLCQWNQLCHPFSSGCLKYHVQKQNLWMAGADSTASPSDWVCRCIVALTLGGAWPCRGYCSVPQSRGSLGGSGPSPSLARPGSFRPWSCSQCLCPRGAESTAAGWSRKTKWKVLFCNTAELSKCVWKLRGSAVEIRAGILSFAMPAKQGWGAFVEWANQLAVRV